MADRHPASRPGISAGVSKTSSASATSRAGIPSTSTSVRRNLFQSQLTRRPTGGSSSSTSTSTETIRLDALSSSQQQSESSSDIVIRDKNGEIHVVDPPTPPFDELDDMALESGRESEKERQRLAEAVRQHQIDQNSVPAQPDELLEAVKASLKAKVAALAEDNWMFEREELPRVQ